MALTDSEKKIVDTNLILCLTEANKRDQTHKTDRSTNQK